MQGGFIGELVFILVLIGINAFFAASEIAIVSLNNAKVKRQAEEGDETAKILTDLIHEPSKFLATIQVGITLSGFFVSASAAVGITHSLASLIRMTGAPFLAKITDSLAFVIVTVFVAFITLIFGELVPKRLALQRSEEISKIVVRPLHLLSVIAFPFVRFLSLTTTAILRMFGYRQDDNDARITEEEIRFMVDVGEEKGVIRETEREMIDNIFEFNDTMVAGIMTPRTDVVAVGIDESIEEIIKVVIYEKYTRIPVYEGSLDNIVGILHTKDLLQGLVSNPGEGLKLKKIIRPAYFVPVYKKIDVLFRELQQRKNHMAVIIDEYGGTAGIVTMEDLLEEIVGNIFDEYDEEEKEVEKLDDSTYMVNGSMDLDRMNDSLDIELPEDEYETLGGFVMGLLGRIPSEDEHPVVEYAGIVFKVEKVDDKRIEKVKVCKAR